MARNEIKDIKEYRRQAVEAMGGDSITFAVGGEEFTIPHPMFYDARTKAALLALEDESDLDGQARILLGAEQYERFVEAGGDPDDIGYVNLEAQRESQGYVQGKPKRRR